jgi:hypothetical protein
VEHKSGVLVVALVGQPLKTRPAYAARIIAAVLERGVLSPHGVGRVDAAVLAVDVAAVVGVRGQELADHARQVAEEVVGVGVRQVRAALVYVAVPAVRVRHADAVGKLLSETGGPGDGLALNHSLPDGLAGRVLGELVGAERHLLGRRRPRVGRDEKRKERW